MNFSWFKMRYFLYLVLIGLWFIWFTNIKVLSGSSYIAIDCDKDIADYPVGVVLGARVIGAKQVSAIYADRLQTGADLYKAGKIKKILVSGDHGQPNYDEVNAGKDYLLAQGVPKSDIFLDHAGFDTYNSMYRAHKIFGVDKALIVTQNFHLPRALYLGHALGIDVLGCRADKQEYQGMANLKFREIFARVKAWLDIFCKASPKYLGETYDMAGNGEQTWDIDIY
jgi:SanA protein